jgi:hypothetical protein
MAVTVGFSALGQSPQAWSKILQVSIFQTGNLDHLPVFPNSIRPINKQLLILTTGYA